LVQATPTGVHVIYIASARLAPVGLEQARGAIEQFVANDRKRLAVTTGLKDLRTQAKLEYLGKFAQPAGASASAPVAAPTPAAVPAASAALDDASLKKGLGLK
jgi:hypothetical protein